jgi:hypothetical protein
VAEFREKEGTAADRMEQIRQKATRLQQKRTEEDAHKADAVMTRKYGFPCLLLLLLLLFVVYVTSFSFAIFLKRDEDDDLRTVRMQTERLQIAADQVIINTSFFLLFVYILASSNKSK